MLSPVSERNARLWSTLAGTGEAAYKMNIIEENVSVTFSTHDRLLQFTGVCCLPFVQHFAQEGRCHSASVTEDYLLDSIAA